MEPLNIYPQSARITCEDRKNLLKQEPMLLWFTGLSGSGKSTLADLTEQRLFEKGYKTYLLDGDNVRSGLNSNLDFSEEGRKENIRRIGEVAKLMLDAGVIVLTAFISPFRSDRDRVRQLAGNRFMEIYVECPLEICEQRDVKGLYARARRGEIPDFTGISSPYEPPLNPEITVHTGREDLESCLNKIVELTLKSVQYT